MSKYGVPPRLNPTDNKEEALDALSSISTHATERAKVFAILAVVDELRQIRYLLTPEDVDDAP